MSIGADRAWTVYFANTHFKKIRIFSGGGGLNPCNSPLGTPVVLLPCGERKFIVYARLTC